MATREPTIEQDLTCGGCDYNLRGLPRDGACPDAGMTSRATLRGFRGAGGVAAAVELGAVLIGGGSLVGGAGWRRRSQWGEPLAALYAADRRGGGRRWGRGCSPVRSDVAA